VTLAIASSRPCTWAGRWVPTPSQEDTILGKLAVERGYLPQERVDQAREIRCKMHDETGTGQPLEQVLIGKHWRIPDQTHRMWHATALETGEARAVDRDEAVP
jgi:hypothetical protein